MWMASQRGLTNLSIVYLSMALCCLASHLSAKGQLCVCLCVLSEGRFGGWMHVSRRGWRCRWGSDGPHLSTASHCPSLYWSGPCVPSQTGGLRQNGSQLNWSKNSLNTLNENTLVVSLQTSVCRHQVVPEISLPAALWTIGERLPGWCLDDIPRLCVWGGVQMAFTDGYCGLRRD